MRNLLFVFLLFTILYSCGDNVGPLNAGLNTDSQDYYEYIKNPNPSDTTCLAQIKRAKKDVKNGKIVFNHPVGLGFGMLRYEEELKEVCKEYGLEYEVELVSCVVFEGQTQGCYGHYMDMVLSNKYGADFKSKLHRKADSLFLFNVLQDEIPVRYWFCDNEPKPILTGQNYLETTIEVSDLDFRRTELGRTWPAMDLSFIIERDGSISKFYTNNYIARDKHNKKYIDQLFNIGVEHIKSNYPKWKPATIKGISVRTDHNVRLTFVGK